MGKITIKHFLNTNLKPYVINKKNYYTIYILITANRKTTKLKSLVFDEYYTEKDFEDIFNSEEITDKNLIANEINAINIISEISIEALSEFNTSFLTAYINFSNTISVWKPETEIKIFERSTFESNNIFGVSIDRIYTEIGKDKEITIFEFFSLETQNIAIKYLKKNNVRNAKTVLNYINKILFYTSLEYFRWYIEGNKKNSDLLNRFYLLFDNYKELIINDIENNYKINDKV